MSLFTVIKLELFFYSSDIDECQNGKPCANANTQCFNTVGSFRCVCNSGFATRNGMAANPICEGKCFFLKNKVLKEKKMESNKKNYPTHWNALKQNFLGELN